MRVYGYARRSRHDDDTSSIEKQEQIIRDYATRHDLELVDIAVDRSASATKTRLDRPGLIEAREAISAGVADAILCWRLDRVARSVVDFSRIVEDGTQVISATEPLDTTSPMGWAMIQIIQVFAELESGTTGVRAKGTKAYLKSLGRWGGGPRPYGYRPVKAPDGIGKVLVVVEEEAAVIRRIFSDLLDGASVNGLARTLNTEGVPTPSARRINERGALVLSAEWSPWQPASILNIARALHVSGYLTEGTGDGSRTRRAVIGADGAPVRAWERIVSDDVAEAVRTKVTPEALDAVRSQATKDGRRAPKRMLEGLVFCTCGKRLIRRTRKGVAYYGCKGVAEGSHILADAEKVEAEAESQFLASFSGVEVVESIVNVPVSAAVQEIDIALAAASAQISGTTTADLPGLFTRIAELTAERERLEQSADQVTTKRTFTPYGEAWASWSVDEKREHMALVGVEVRIRPAARRGAWDPTRVRLSAGHDYLAGQLD